MVDFTFEISFLISQFLFDARVTHFANPVCDISWTLFVTFREPCLWYFANPVCDISWTLFVTFREPCLWHFANPVCDISRTLFVTFRESCLWHFANPVCDISRTLFVTFREPCLWHGDWSGGLSHCSERVQTPIKPLGSFLFLVLPLRKAWTHLSPSYQLCVKKYR